MRAIGLAVAGLAGVLSSVALSAPATQPGIDYATVDASAPVELYELTLDAAYGAKPLIVRVWCRGGKFGTAWATTPAVPGDFLPAITSFHGFYNVTRDGLSRKADALSGAICVGSNAAYMTVTATVSGDKITGTYQGDIPSDRGRSTPVNGKLTGAIRKAADLRGTNDALAKGAAYVGFRNHGSGVGFETGAKLVDAPDKARLVWKSEDLIPPPYHEGINFARPIAIQAGHASPVLLDGKICISYFVGNAQTADMNRYKEATDHMAQGKGGVMPPAAAIEALKKCGVEADQIIVCMDATTGRTLWKTSFPADGQNITRSYSRHGLFGPSNKDGSHLTPCVGDGKVFAKGTSDSIYCLDLETGKTIWTKPRAWDRGDKAMGGGKGSGASTDSCQYADGVMATAYGGQLTGFDAQTGKVLWQSSDYRGQTTHLRVVLNDPSGQPRECFYAATGKLIEPRTGKVLWAIQPAFTGGVNAIGDGYLVHLEMGAFTAAYRITPQKAERVWENRQITHCRQAHPVIYKGHAYVRWNPGGGADDEKDQTDAPATGVAGSDGRRNICIELATGKVVAANMIGTRSFSSITAGDGLIFNCNAARVYLQKAAGSGYADLPGGGARNALWGTPETTGIYADGRFFTRGFDGILCYDMRAQ